MAMKFWLVLKPRAALGLLQQPVHRLDEGVAAVIEHAAHDASNRSLSVAASFLNGSSRQRRAQLSQALRSDAACSMLLCAVAARRPRAAPSSAATPARS
jgi:hypothetical protein